MSSHSRLLLQKTVELSAPLQDIHEYQNVVTEPPTIETPVSNAIKILDLLCNFASFFRDLLPLMFPLSNLAYPICCLVHKMN